MDFPEIEYNSDMTPLYHTIQLVASLDLVNDEFKITNEIEEQLQKKYWIDKEKDQIIIAKLEVTEFPNEFR